ncbi:DUF4921 family protein [Tessaracoccus lubricantis]|uniref:DUF4921 family protein n=1 Tax=Tessaracoccus lubricantis TaxID=545543 RepID=A0ABP9FPE2_9ACTN
MTLFVREPEYITELRDGTVKQLNPFTGTEVWTVPGRGDRPLGLVAPHPLPLRDGELGRHCAFCEQRYLDTPPEKSRVVRHDDGTWETLYRTPAESLFDTVAQFRRVPNLFEILSFDYWHENYGFELPPAVAERRAAYLASPAGLDHVMRVVEAKLYARGLTDAQVAAMGHDDLIAQASGFFGGGHDVIIARRHFVDDAADDSQLASSGTLTPEEHAQFIAYTVECTRMAFEVNRYARYVVVFQNWLKPAGASFDHLHKQLVSIDDRGNQHDAALVRLRANPNIFNEAGANYAAQHNLVIAENEHAVAFAGFGHRYPTIEVYSRSEHCDPWDQHPDEIRGMSDMIHAMHAATGADVPTNEEWHYRPIDVNLAMPWRVMLKWRVSTVAGFEGATKIYLNTISPTSIRDRVVSALYPLRERGLVAAGLRIATEASCAPNPLRYSR